MNILFLTLVEIDDIDRQGIYTDLLREFVSHRDCVYVLSANEKRNNTPTHLIDKGQCKILRVQTGNIQKTNKIEKGISTITLEKKYLSAIKKYFNEVTFDLVLYSTPPITFYKVIKYIKNKDMAKSYLLLKDIFPQNAVDIGMMRKNGPIYKFFRSMEKRLYSISDFIGCMSPANAKYVIVHNPSLNPDIIHVNPNSVAPILNSISIEEKNRIRDNFGLPKDKRIFIYGGNLGKPQDIPFIIECLKTQMVKADRFFLISGSGTEYPVIEQFFDSEKPNNMKLMNTLPRDEYSNLVSACDVGMIFLDYRFTIPNFPSRLLSYMEASIPVLACTDPNTDIGCTIVDGKFGWHCISDNVQLFKETVDEICSLPDLSKHGKSARKYLNEHYLASDSYKTILDQLGL